MKGEALINEFDRPSNQDWEDKIIAELKGKALTSIQWNIEGLPPISPAQMEHSHPIKISRKQPENGWQIIERISYQDAKQGNGQLLALLNQGINAPLIELRAANIREDLPKLLDKVHLEYIHLHLRISNPDKLSGSTIIDLIKEGMGNSYTNFKGSVFVDGILLDFQNKAIQSSSLPELLIHPDTIVANLLTVITHYIDSNAASNSMILPISLQDYFLLNIASMRAVKILMANVNKVKGEVVDALPQLFCKTSNTTDFQNDRHKQVIAATAMSLSAIIAGADGLEILPFENESSSKRINRNIHHILSFESYLDRVIDPASGGYYLDQLTASLCTVVWERIKKG